jgi:hypothetical protein
MGLASIVSFRTTASAQDAERNFITDWETALGGTHSTGRAVRWRTVRAWKSRKVIAERNRGPTIAEAISHPMMHTSMLAREEAWIFEGLVFFGLIGLLRPVERPPA